ncbi:MAG: Serine--tRNA ligase, mitochondrial [Chrysothrix sp. TS-e1954]|nr:MAG: Serine--tRNA ligase, mitochondrial [Chrysothrix sp. TS-e1954]
MNIGRRAIPSACPFCIDLSRVSRVVGPKFRPTRLYHRPSNAPKPQIDIKHIAKNPGLYEQNCLDRNYKGQSRNSWTILELRERLAQVYARRAEVQIRNRDVKNGIQKVQEGKSAADEHSGKEGIKDGDLDTLMQEAKLLKQENHTLRGQELSLEAQSLNLALDIPNLSSFHTPNGNEPEVVREHRNQHTLANTSNFSHVDIGTRLGILDLAGGASTSGWGWYFLKGAGALLEQALIQYTLSTLHSRRWTLVSPPSIVYSHIAAACGFQPRDENGEQQIYDLKQSEKDADKPSLSLAGTAEIPLAGMRSQSKIDEKDLPLRTAGVSRCYRAEAGARGADTKGLYRVHEFTKVEMFAWTRPDEGNDEAQATNAANRTSAREVFDEMVDIQSEILTDLGLDFRILEMPSTDLGASASRKRDIEVFFTSRRSKNEGWGEVTSASICTDYQSRRLDTRIRKKDGSLDFPYTVNATAMAVPRVIAAVLETHWDQAREVVEVPKVLQPWMFGMKQISSTVVSQST